MDAPLTVGFLVNDLLSGYQARLLSGLTDAARRHDVRLVVFAGGYLSSDTPLFDGSFLFEMARKPALDGLIVETGILATQAGSRAVTDLCGRLNLPYVSVGYLAGVPSVEVGEGVGVSQLVEHLLFDHQRRRFAFVRGPEGNPSSALREAAFRATLRQHHIALDEGCILPGDFLEPSGFDAIRLLEKRGKLETIDAIVAANDHMALGAMAGLRERGLEIPSRVSVVGFDDDELALAAKPPLSTVRQPLEALGAAALEALLPALDHQTIAERTTVPVELVVRQSCGCEPAPSTQGVVSSNGYPPIPPEGAHYELHRHIHLAHAVSLLGSALSSARDTASIERIVRGTLPHIGIPTCAVFLFTSDEPMAANSGGRTSPPVRLAARHYEPTRSGMFQRILEIWRQMPSAYPPASRPLSNRVTSTNDADWLARVPTGTPLQGLIIHPLTFAEQGLGFVVFALPDNLRDAWLLEAVAGHLSGTLANIRKGERLREARANAEAASAAKGEFVAMVSHELRTPLTAVLGHLDLARREALSPSLRQRVELAQGSAKSLLRIINDLLDFSKLEAERVEVESVAFHIEEVFHQVLTTCSLAVAKKGLEFVFDIDPNVPSILVGDPLRLAQMLINLISNSTKFSSVGRIVVGLELLDRQSDDSVTVRFSVTDTGIGMSPAQVRNLFQPFTQGDSSTTRRYGGTGLGLAISQRLAHLLGCEIIATSSPGSGSCFEFSPSLLAPRELATPQSESSRAHWVLLVEPDAEQAQAISRSLASHGHRVYWAADISTARYIIGQTSNAFELCLFGLPTGGALDAGPTDLFPDPASRPRVVLLNAVTDAEAPTGVENFEQLTKPVLPSHLYNLFFKAGSLSTLPPRAALVGRRLLLVQDNQTSRDVMCAMLSTCGALVSVAETGAHAVSEAKHNPFDIVLMDINLPDMDGYEATRRIKLLPLEAPLPIVAVTADARPATRTKCLAAGMDDCIVTPLSSTDLCSAIARALNRARNDSMAPSAPFNTAWARHSVDAFNAERGLRQVGGNPITFRDILTRFCQQYGDAPRFASIPSEPKGDLRLIHGLVSAAGNVGAALLSRKAQSIELALREGANIGVEQWLDLELTWEQATAAIGAYLRDNPLPSGPVPTPPNQAGLFDALEQALQQHDTVAIDLLPEAGRVLRTRVAPHQVTRFEEAVRSYDFEGSLSQFRALLSNL